MLELLPAGAIEVFGLVLARTAAVVLSAPLLGAGTGFSGFKVALVVGVAAVLAPVVWEPLGPVAPVAYGLMVLHEVLVGLFLGFLLQLVLLVVRVAGQLVGQEMGFMIARQVDPATGIDTPLITSVYETLFVLALLSLNGHHWLLASLGRSFDHAPLGELALAPTVTATVQSMFGEMFRAGIVFAAPVMVFLMLVSILIGLLSRVVTHLNVLEIGFTLRVGMALCAMFLFAPLLEPALEGLQRDLGAWLDRGLEALGS